LAVASGLTLPASLSMIGRKPGNFKCERDWGRLTEMAAFGEGLRREREMRNISLDEIAATTKIGTRLLRALEEEQFDLLPGGIFNKGYVRAYAKYVGIDEEKAIAGYLQAAHQAAPGGHAVADQNPSSRFERSSRNMASAGRRSPLPVVPILIALVVVAGVAGGWRVYREHQLDRQHRAAIEPVRDMTRASPPSPAPASVPTAKKSLSPQTPPDTTTPAQTGATTSAKPAAAMAGTQPLATTPISLAAETNKVANSVAAAPFELTVRPKDRAWVSIKSDGKFVVHGVIQPPEVKTIRATKQVIFWTGNAGAVEVSFNGKNVPLTGGENQERVLVFDSRGLLPVPASQ
jgi:cytoskeleton protein RodZ